MAKLIYFVLFGIFILSGSLVDGLRCHSCSNVNDNEDCNDEPIVSCDSGESCFTVVERLESVGKIYSKGCRSTRTCERLERLNDPDICNFFPSECWYCCDSENKCNAYNAANNVRISGITTIVSSVLLMVLGLIL